MPGLVVRPMEDGDQDRVVALWHAAGVARPWNDPARDIEFARRGPHSTLLVGWLDGDLVASAMVGEDGHRGWVHYVAADPAHAGRGLGRAIMQAAEDWLGRRGVWKVQLLVRGDNARVIGFYEHLGYRNTQSVCLQKIIGEG
jgi:ribosomal protein S18 acetylase RimI-like enzyme